MLIFSSHPPFLRNLSQLWTYSGFPDWLCVLMLAYQSSMMLLFARFYKQSYGAKGSAKKQLVAKKNNNKVKGSE